ncbi:hypothetical protein [Butyrivibrio sp. INlla16]|uniref:hypothetical protein n=1 Tax=Butyrivibrio sp. INlla16 TaxID=1520807 RepID=UPI00087FAE68|nr:hypothetical protein [Butyrivibrio sp. INlla16]SDB17941.1 hypothetical protein SAMN02910263_00858 [Butyrivibrio sp. INlla16]
MISAFFEFLTKGLIWIIKNIFDMIGFFLRLLFWLLRLFLLILPVTGIVYSLFFIALIIEVFAGESVLSSILPINFDSTSTKNLILETLQGYLSLLSQYSGTLMYFILFLFLLILAVPIFLVFIGAGTFVYAGRILLIPVLIDLFGYLVGSVIIGKSSSDVFKARYRRLFPSVGRKLNEKSYDRWLQRHHDEFENDTFGQTKKQKALDDFYEEDYEDEYEDDYEEYENDYDGYENESELYYEDDYDDAEYDEEPINNPFSKSFKRSTNAEHFNFFAGCTTLDSANKKYKSLVKLYHPDNMDGDTSALQEINYQYNEVKKRLG